MSQLLLMNVLADIAFLHFNPHAVLTVQDEGQPDGTQGWKKSLNVNMRLKIMFITFLKTSLK